MPSLKRSALSTKISIDTNQTLDSLLHQVLNLALVVCKADAGSLMLVDNKRGILQIKARLGPPRAGRTQEPIYSIGDSSVAGWVAKHKKAYLCPDVSKDLYFAASRSGNNFASLLSVPIVHNGKPLAVINADSIHRGFFNVGHKSQLMKVAKQCVKPISTESVSPTRLPKSVSNLPVCRKVVELNRF